MPKKKSSPVEVELDELLAAEYNYIAQTAAQANEDRARVSSFYLIAVGSLVAAFFSAQFFDPKFFSQTVEFMFSGLFILLTLLGTSTTMQLARLRAAWYESMQAMNQLKDFMISQHPELSRAFRWQTHALPPKYKTNSVSYYQAIEVALVSGLTFGAAIFFLQHAVNFGGLNSWAVSAVAGTLVISIELNLYKRMLK